MVIGTRPAGTARTSSPPAASGTARARGPTANSDSTGTAVTTGAALAARSTRFADTDDFRAVRTRATATAGAPGAACARRTCFSAITRTGRTADTGCPARPAGATGKPVTTGIRPAITAGPA